MKRRLASSVLGKRMEFFSQYETADLLTRISGDIDSLSVLIFDYIYRFSLNMNQKGPMS